MGISLISWRLWWVLSLLDGASSFDSACLVFSVVVSTVSVIKVKCDRNITA